MPKKVKSWKAEAVFTGDSANFHIYQIVSDRMVGSIYLNKKKVDEDFLPNELGVTLLNPSDVKWKENTTKLHESARKGSKAKAKLLKILKENS